MTHLRYTDFRNFENLPRFSDSQFMTQCVGRPLCPLACVAGFRPQMVRFCYMHSVHLGICQFVNASGVYELIKYGYLGGNPNATLSDHLDCLPRRLNSWCAMSNIRQDLFLFFPSNFVVRLHNHTKISQG